MYRDQQCLPRQLYREQCKEGEEEADKKPWENNISKWTRLKFCDALRESGKKPNRGEGLLGRWCPNDHHDYWVGAGAYTYCTEFFLT